MHEAKATDSSDNTPVRAADLYCPRCGSEKLHRSHRDNAYERYVLKLVGVHPYRCESCNERFYSRKRVGNW